MAKKTTFVGFLNYDTQHLIYEAANMMRYNPLLAFEWFAEAAQKTTSPFITGLYNRKAREANNYLEQLSRMQYYNEKEFWSGNKPSRIPYLEERVDLLAEIEKMASQNKL